MKLKQFDHQDAAWADMKKFSRRIYWIGTGLGKTIIILKHLKEQTGLNLVVTKATLLKTFTGDNDKFEEFGFPLMILNDMKKLKSEGKYVTSFDFLRQHMYVYEECKPCSGTGEYNRKKCYKCKGKRRNRVPSVFMGLKWNNIYLDEAHTTGNRDSQTSKMFANWRPKHVLTANSMRLFTGTLIPNRIEQIFPQLRIAGYENTFTKFAEEFLYHPTPNPYHWKLRPEKEAALWELVNRYTFKVERKDTGIELGLKNYHYYEFPMTHEQAEAHRSILKDGCYDKIVLDYAISKFVKLRQITSGFLSDGIDVDRYQFNNHRPYVLDQVFGTLVDETHLIVFYCFDKDLATIMRVSENRNRDFYLVCGTMGSTKKDNAVQAWKKTGGVLAMQIRSGKNGLTLLESRHTIYYNLEDNNEAYEQSQDRTSRIGQVYKDIHYHLLVATNSIDSQIISSLKNKKNIQEELKAWMKKEASK